MTPHLCRHLIWKTESMCNGHGPSRVLTRGFFTVLVWALAPLTYAADDNSIAAFKKDPAVQFQIRQLKEETGGGYEEEFQVVPLHSSCGHTGCVFTDLVVMKLNIGGRLAVTSSIMAIVRGRDGKVQKVQLVEEPEDGAKARLQPVTLKMTTSVFTLHEKHETEDGERCDLLKGIYSSEEKAAGAVKEAIEQQNPAKRPQKTQGDFYINEEQLDVNIYD